MTKEEVIDFLDIYFPDFAKEIRDNYSIPRLEKTTVKEIQDYTEIMYMNSRTLTDKMRKKLKICEKSPKMKNSYIKYFERHIQFIKEELKAYLSGEQSYKPEVYSFKNNIKLTNKLNDSKIKITYSRVLKFLNRLKDKNPSLLKEGEGILIDQINNPINNCFSKFERLTFQEKRSFYLSVKIGLSWKMEQRISMCKTKQEKILWEEKFIEIKSGNRNSWEKYLLSGEEKDKPDKLLD